MNYRHWRFLFVLSLSMCYPLTPHAQENRKEPLEITRRQKAKQTHLKDDLDAIGSREIGKKGLGNWYSLEREIGMGREYSQAIEENVMLLQDATITEYVNRVGQNLVRNSDAKLPFTIKVIDSDDVNAFALPGGFLYVNTGLIMATENEAELAGVMAHEIAHVAARHSVRQLTRSQLFKLASAPLVFAGGIGFAVQEALSCAAVLSLTKFARGFEQEADYLGVEYLYKTGYDPLAFITFFERIQAEEKEQPGFIDKTFASHPQTSDRIRKTQKEIANILPPRDAYIINTSDFEAAKHRVALILNGRVTRESQKDVSRPKLRRRPNVEDENKAETEKRN